MKKFKLFIDMKKEEQYLKEMAAQGWGLVKYSAWNIYTFERMTPETRNYKIDYRTFPTKADYLAYRTLFEDSGWQVISSSKSSGFHFFLPQDHKDQDLDIFSDIPSSNERYRRFYNQATLFGGLALIYLLLLQPSFKNISSWYLTPTLWEYRGLQLVGMVILQTFFLLVQVLPFLLLLAIAVYYLTAGVKAKKIIER